MSSQLTADIQWLNACLDEIESPTVRDDVELARGEARAMLESNASSGLADLDAARIHGVLKVLTIRFHLRNKAEQVHIVRVNRERARRATPDAPRPESLDEAVGALRRAKVPLEQLVEIIERLDIRPTLTAHPTESRRRAILHKQRRIGDLLATRDDTDRVRNDVRRTLSLLLATDEVRSRRLDVIDEVRNGLHYLAGTIWDALPTLQRDLRETVRAHYGGDATLPAPVRYRSWIGGDRDGNPNVTAELTRRAFDEMRQAAVERHAEMLERLRRDLSLSDRRVAIDPRLIESIRRDDAERPLDLHTVRHLEREPFRVKIKHMQMRLGDRAYTARRLVEDLRILGDALIHAGLDEVAQDGPLADALVAARAFGFHLAALDVRQHSGVHERAVAELLRHAGSVDDYASLDEDARVARLQDELRTSRPLLARDAQPSEQTRELLDSLEVIAAAAREDEDSVGAYVVSMAHDVSDLLEVLVLLREVGLWSIEDGAVRCALDVVPLFETVDDLAHAGDVMQRLFREPAYAAQLAARGGVQEIMLGYSDSNKDGGYWTANWRLYRAQDDLARTCRNAGVDFRFFHGRGGTVARGGGRAHRAILSSPPGSITGGIRFTEQGEVISFRYAMPELAHRHLEQIVNAMICSAASIDRAEPPDDETSALMDALADRSRETYRALIDDPAFWTWFIDASPVLHIGELPIASRPVSRSGGATGFENLRAIPWVFAWTQMRYNAPGWYGMGTAFDELVMPHAVQLDRCRAAYAAGGFFRAFIDNAQQEMARARLDVAQWYAGAAGADLHTRLADEFGRAERAILAITGQTALLDNNPVIQQSIRERNPDTDVLNALQVELLRRWREADGDERDALHGLIMLSVNALAAAMQSTG